MPLFVLILSVLITVLTTKGIRVVRERMDADQQEMLRAWVHIAVYASEKLYGAGRGTEKLEYAKKLLEEQGFTLNVDTLEAMVNAEIQEMLMKVLKRGHAKTYMRRSFITEYQGRQC